MIGYKLKDSFLDSAYLDFVRLNISALKITFQEYIESNFAPTQHLKEWFIKNDVPFLSDFEITQKRKEEVVLKCICNV